MGHFNFCSQLGMVSDFKRFERQVFLFHTRITKNNPNINIQNNDSISEVCNNFVKDLHDGPYGFSFSHTTERSPALLTGTRSTSRCSVRVPRRSLVSAELFVLWLSDWLLAQTVSILQDYCNPETAGCVRWELCPFAGGWFLGGVTALTNEAGCMAEHHLRPANLISSIRRNGRIFERQGPKPSQLDWIFLSVTDFWSRFSSELM